MFGPSKEVLVSLQELLPKISRNIYISQPYDDIYMTRTYYHQCTFLQKFALQMDFSGKILSYGDYQFYDLLEQISDKSRLYAYIPPALGILKEYDRKNGTSLFETLETYIHCQYNATKTASALFIHRNSLSYTDGKNRRADPYRLQRYESALSPGCWFLYGTLLI